MQRLKVFSLGGWAPSATVHVGAQVQDLPCAYVPDFDMLGLPDEFLTGLGVQQGQELNVMAFDGWRDIHIGPLVGYLLGPPAKSKLEARSQLLQQAAADARAAGVMVCFFDMDGVDLGNERIRGWIDGGGKWVAAEMPLPDIVYNRDTYPSLRRRAAAAALRHALAAFHGVNLLNSVQAFRKLETHELLRFYTQTAPLSPETVPFKHADDLSDMLSRYRHVFVKADRGSHGSAVMRVSDEGDRWLLSGKHGGLPVRQEFDSVEQLFRYLEDLGMENRIIQQGIDLPQVEGRPFDLRTIVQKDRRGEWVSVITFVRWAAPDQVASNTSQGGEVFTPDNFLKRFSSQLHGFSGMEGEADTVALQVAEVLESHLGSLGEVGVDIGLDRDGRPWVFEANTKPRHRLLPDLSLTRHVFDYAVFLAGQKWSGQRTKLSWRTERT